MAYVMVLAVVVIVVPTACSMYRKTCSSICSTLLVHGNS